MSGAGNLASSSVVSDRRLGFRSTCWYSTTRPFNSSGKPG